MDLLKSVGIATDTDVYFCDPAIRGNADPARTPTACCDSINLNAYGPEDLEHAAQKLNGASNFCHACVAGASDHCEVVGLPR